MLKRENRLRGRKNLALMRKEGELFQNPLFGVVILEGKEENRFGIVISKKISKLAVERNKIRRRIYEAVAKELKEMRKGIWVLFLVKREIMERESEEIVREVKKVLKR